MMANRLKKILAAGCLTLLMCLAGAGFFYYQVRSFMQTPAAPGDPAHLFCIRPGQSLSAIAAALEKEGFITDRHYFKFFVRLNRAGTRLQAGEYLLSAAQPPYQILDTLVSGKVKLYRVTVPEGLNIRETARVMQKAGLCRAPDFTRLCHDRDFISNLDIRADSLEGYLFPDTYFFPKNTACQSIISTMASRFNSIFTAQWEKRARDLNFSRHEIVTLASMIEKETGDASERPVISSVFHNRLGKRMRLESDPTVIYGIKNFDGNIKRKHLKMVTPYNTYQIRGLPAGPIANPGKLALAAALYPDQTDYLFFVSKNDTTHQFSRTITEHNRAVRKYQLGKK